MKKLSLAVISSLACVHMANAAVSIAAIEDKDGTYYYAVTNNQETAAEAKKISLERCKDYAASAGLKNRCREAFSHPGPSYFAIVENVPGTKPRLGIFAAQGRQEAINGAYTQCNQNGQYQCKDSPAVIAWDGGAGQQAEPRQQPVVNQTVNGTPSYRDRMKALRKDLDMSGRDGIQR